MAKLLLREVTVLYSWT